MRDGRVVRQLFSEGKGPCFLAPGAQLHRDRDRDRDSVSLGPPLRRETGLAIQIDSGAARWWTFAGGRINHTLKHALGRERGWRVVADNFHLRLTGAGVSYDSIAAALAILRADNFWENPQTRSAILARLPNYRLSKFQSLLPDAAAVELVASYLLDVTGTLRFLTQVPKRARIS